MGDIATGCFPPKADSQSIVYTALLAAIDEII
jgi:hypothetical protein